MTIAIYPGSFNPFTIGHLNILEKAEKIFGEGNVIVAIGSNPAKDTEDKTSILSRSKYIQDKIGRRVEIYTTFLHEYIQSKEDEGYNVIMVRGLRNGDDLAYENNQLRFIEEFKPDIKSVFIMCDKKFEHVSSSAIRQLESFRKGSSKQYVI